MLSLICVYNDEKKLEKYLLSSLKEQTSPYDLVLIDNTKKEFKSAAEALNFGALKAKGDYFVFLHQDISFTSKQSLEKLEKILQQLPQKVIIGPAGALQLDKKNSVVVTNIMHGEPPLYAGGYTGLKINAPYRVQTLDECMIVIPKEVFDILKFDNIVCNGWHLYGVDYCISASRMNIPICAVPADVYHGSNGSNSMNNEYYNILKKVARKHRSSVDFLNTTTGCWPTSWLLLNIKIIKILTYKFMNKFTIGRKVIEFRRNLKQRIEGDK